MIMRQHVDGISVEGLSVTVNGLTMSISPGSITTPGGSGTLEEITTLDFSSLQNTNDVIIGFDIFGRMFVDCHERGGQPTGENQFGVLTHYVYFTIEANTESLNDIIINVLFESVD